MVYYILSNSIYFHPTAGANLSAARKKSSDGSLGMKSNKQTTAHKPTSAPMPSSTAANKQTSHMSEKRSGKLCMIDSHCSHFQCKDNEKYKMNEVGTW